MRIPLRRTGERTHRRVRLDHDRQSELGESLSDNALEAFISRLRRRVAPAGVQIRTLRGLGYVLEEVAP